jgi:hypothetical protein
MALDGAEATHSGVLLKKSRNKARRVATRPPDLRVQRPTARWPCTQPRVPYVRAQNTPMHWQSRYVELRADGLLAYYSGAAERHMSFARHGGAKGPGAGGVAGSARDGKGDAVGSAESVLPTKCLDVAGARVISLRAPYHGKTHGALSSVEKRAHSQCTRGARGSLIAPLGCAAARSLPGHPPRRTAAPLLCCAQRRRSRRVDPRPRARLGHSHCRTRGHGRCGGRPCVGGAGHAVSWLGARTRSDDAHAGCAAVGHDRACPRRQADPTAHRNGAVGGEGAADGTGGWQACHGDPF